MLFVLDSSLLTIDPNSDVQIASLENLLSAYRNKFHLLFAKLSDAKALHDSLSGSLSVPGRKNLAALYSQLPSYKQVVDKVQHRVTVCLSAEKSVKKEGGNWLVPLEYFKNGLLQSTILGEDDKDAELFLILGDHYRLSEKINGFGSRARLRGGGGAGISRSLTTYLSGEYSPCICITDSDKLHPRYRRSATVKTCEIIANSSVNIVKYLSLEEREIENLLPLKILHKSTPRVSELFRNVEEVTGYSQEMWKYIDIKSGVCLKWIRSKDEVTRSYWQCFDDHLERKNRTCLLCTVKDNCKICPATAMSGAGEKILENSILYLKANPSRLNLRLMNDDIRWKSVGQIVFDYTIAPQGELTR